MYFLRLLIISIIITVSGIQSFSQELVKADYSKDFNYNDTIFSSPFIDKDERRNSPIPHRYVHGGFNNTETRFSFYLPIKEKYTDRFFQYVTPFPDEETLSQAGKGEEDKISFALSHGAYFIETNGGGKTDFTKPQLAKDPTIGAYRANAASAQFSRLVANKLFNKKRPFGYLFGGSGGAYRTVGGIENTTDVWDGAVPYVLGSPMAIPNVFTVRMHAMRVLQDKFPQIIDAMDAGGSGDPYSGLNEEEKEALLEVTRMGFPLKSWYGYKTMGIHGFLVLYQSIVMIDNAYFIEDFWNKEGYLGAHPSTSLLKSRIREMTTIKSILSLDQALKSNLVNPISPQERGTADAAWKSLGGMQDERPIGFNLNNTLPNVHFLGGDLNILSGNAKGKTLQITKVVNDQILLGPTDPAILILVKPGDTVQVDNSNFLAVQTYHRHQVPDKEFSVWDQFRNPDGSPRYPQRSFLLGPLFTRGAAGVLPTGKFKGKMILLESLWDREAFAWQADWYRSKVKQNLGDSLNDHFRVWYTDRALHGDVSLEDDPTQTISYLGVLQQALLDLSDWVERGIAPASSTQYTIRDGQVVVPEQASHRKGIQPTIILKANNSKVANIKVGQKVNFTATIEVPENQGKVVAAAWNFEGIDTPIKPISDFNFMKSSIFPEKAKFAIASKVSIGTVHAFHKPGVYFPSLRIASQRHGDDKTLFTRIQNLDRVRVVVNE